MRNVIFILTSMLTAQLLLYTNSTWCAESDEGVKVEITLSEEYPIKGKECIVTVDGISDTQSAESAVEVWVTYRPNSLVERFERLTRRGGVFRWRPEDAGICTITAVRPEAETGAQSEPESIPGGEKLAEKNVAVRFGSFPPTGILIFLIAGVTLFGGMIWSMSKLMRRPYEGE